MALIATRRRQWHCARGAFFLPTHRTAHTSLYILEPRVPAAQRREQVWRNLAFVQTQFAFQMQFAYPKFSPEFVDFQVPHGRYCA